MYQFLKNVLLLFGVCFLRFRWLPRLWVTWLVAVNVGCLAFILQPEGQVVLGVTGVAVVIQALMLGRIGFTRILGITHLLWLPMFAWMATRADHYADQPQLRIWLTVLLATNAISLAVDVTDSVRFLRGERAPHYQW